MYIVTLQKGYTEITFKYGAMADVTTLLLSVLNHSEDDIKVVIRKEKEVKEDESL